MAVEVGPVVSFLAQRIVLAPAQVEPPRAVGRGVAISRFREGLTSEAAFRVEMASLGYLPGDISRALVEAQFQRDFDLFQDRLKVLQEAYDKDLLTYEELKAQLLLLVPDQVKALVLLDLYDFSKRPKPKPLTPEEPPTLTVGRLLAAFKAGVLDRGGLEAELGTRGYSPEDIAVLVATEEAKVKAPKPAARKTLTLADLKALLALGLLSPEDFVAELVDRTYTLEDAQNLLALEQAKALTRAA